MNAAYHELLTATIDHLEGLRRNGVIALPVSPDTLAELKQRPAPVVPVSAPSRPAAPAPEPAFRRASIKAPETKPVVERAEVPKSPVTVDLSGPPMDAEAKAAAMAHLRERALACQKCSHLVRSRRNVVFGVGDINADLMFVGEAPGMDEDAQGEPFVGKAGQLLTRIIETMGLSRERVYIGNVLKCRPDTPGKRFGNRKPTPDEMATCRPFLLEQIRIIRPKVLVALGATAVEGLMGQKSVMITRYRGEFRDFGGIPLMPTYHPSYVLRNQSHRIKRQIWEDMLQAMERLGMPISEKQRNYFAPRAS